MISADTIRGNGDETGKLGLIYFVSELNQVGYKNFCHEKLF